MAVTSAMRMLKKAVREMLPGSAYLRHQQSNIVDRLPERIRTIIDSLGPADTCIDCGANVGAATCLFARKGATVYAFEPHPRAYRELARNTGRIKSIHIMNEAVVVDQQQTVRLLFTDLHGRDALKASVGASMVTSKPNVGVEGVEVKARNLGQFIREHGPVKLLKVDVEGYEVHLIPALIESGCLDQVDHVFLELHMSDAWPEVKTLSQAMLRQIEASSYKNKFFFDWP